MTSPHTELLIRQAMKAETPQARFDAIMKAYFDHDFREDGIDDFVRALAAHLTHVPVPVEKAA